VLIDELIFGTSSLAASSLSSTWMSNKIILSTFLTGGDSEMNMHGSVIKALNLGN
jgi:hypothetical protein